MRYRSVKGRSGLGSRTGKDLIRTAFSMYSLNVFGQGDSFQNSVFGRAHEFPLGYTTPEYITLSAKHPTDLNRGGTDYA